jgi:hypothetical protein
MGDPLLRFSKTFQGQVSIIAIQGRIDARHAFDP